MKGSIFVIAASALVAAASAGTFHERRAGHVQVHELAKRGDTEARTANGTSYSSITVHTTWYGEASMIFESTSSSVAVITSSVETTSTPSATPTSTYALPPISTATTPALNSAAAVYGGWSGGSSGQIDMNKGVPNSGSSAQLSSGGSLYAMSYTPYKTDNGDSRCASAEEVLQDIALIAAKGFTTVRTYATDCNGLENIGSACKKAGLKIIVGIYVDNTGLDSSEVSDQLKDITDYFDGDYSIVEMVLVGNEVLFNDFATAAALAAKISSIKQTLRDCGYNGPVSTADTVASLQEFQGELCDSLDILAANIHPFFDDETSATNAGRFVNEQMELLGGLCGGAKKVINSETGWPSQGYANGAAIPNRAQQSIAIESIKQAAGASSCFFSFENDYWKGSGYLDVESYWGCSDLFEG